MKHTKVCYHEKLDGLVLKSKLVSNITITLKLTLPRCLMPSYFVKHKLCKQDVLSILDTLPSREVWLLGLAIGAGNLAPSCFRTAYSNLQDISITSKATVIRKILNKLDYLFFLNKEPVLDNSAVSLHHVPALPKHFIPHADFLHLSQDIFLFLNIFEIIQVNKLFHYADRTWIAIAFEGDFIFALRTVPIEIYNKSRREKYGGFSTRMPVIQVQDKQYKILCDDGILFASN